MTVQTFASKNHLTRKPWLQLPLLFGALSSAKSKKRAECATIRRLFTTFATHTNVGSKLSATMNILKLHIRRLCLFAIAMLCCTTMLAQRTEVYSTDIGRVEVAVNGDEARLPILHLGSGDRLNISFDALTPEYQRFTYAIEHCDPVWNTTDGLFDSEYMANPPDGDVIEDYEQSSLTATLYTHYSFSIPGKRGEARPLVSGNYRLKVFADDEESPVFVCRFMVVDTKAKLAVHATTNTDVDYNSHHQQLFVTADMGELPLFNHGEETRLVCVQNRSDTYTIMAPAPTSVAGSVLMWDHCRSLIFPAGNEYRKFEMPSTRVPGMHVDRIRYDDEGYTALLLSEQPHKGYYFDEDQNGRALIYSDRSYNSATEADYVLTRFTLLSEEEPGTKIYIDGWWTDGSDKYLMQYNPDAGAYEADILLKQGYYSYRYLAAAPGGCTDGGVVVYNVDGDYYQTENEYTSYLYYRPAGGRYWQLVAVEDFNYKP